MHRLFTADGSCTERATNAAAAAFVQAHHGEPVWVDIEAPDDADFALLRDTFGAHPLTIEDIRNQNQRPKLEEFAEYVFLVLFVTEWTSDEPVQREHHIYFNPARRTVITVHLEPAPALDRLRARIVAAPELARRTVSFLFYLVIDTLVDALFPILDRLDDEIDDLEDRILGRQRPDVVSRQDAVGLRRLACWEGP